MMAKKYRKKPVVIEAVQWTGLNLEEIKSFVGKPLRYSIADAAWEAGKGAPHILMTIKTLEGDHIASVGDYIIKGVHGEFYPCKPDIFAKTYEDATIDPESLRPKGEWVDDKDDVYWHNHFIHKHCSLCAAEAIYDYSKSRYILTDFCPNCGADMRGET